MQIGYLNKNSFVGLGASGPAVGANTRIVFASVPIDDMSGWDGTKWNCKSAGEYKGVWYVRLNGTAPTVGQFAGAYVLLNGATKKKQNYAYVANTNVQTYYLVIPFQLKLNLNDYLEFYADTNLTSSTIATAVEDISVEIMKVG